MGEVERSIDVEIVANALADYDASFENALMLVRRLEQLVNLMSVCVKYGEIEMPVFRPLNPLLNGIRTTERRIRDMQTLVERRIGLSKNKETEQRELSDRLATNS